MEFIGTFLKHTFMQNALYAGIMASFACGITGTFVIIKRITFISGGIAHTALGGIGVALYLGINPIAGAAIASIIAAVLLGIVTIRADEQADTMIGALWAVGMAVGVIFISLTPGYNANLLTYLFGNILMVSDSDLKILVILNACIFILVMVFYRQFVAISFDEGYSRIRGLRVNFVYILLLCIIALTVVILIHIVGLILVIALLTIPAAVSRLFVKRIGGIIVTSVLFGLIFTVSGLAASFNLNYPAGATIIMISGIIYFVALGIRKIYR